jgi:hypothetical protein
VLAARAAADGSHDADRVLQVLLDDPAAWLAVDVPAGFFATGIEPVLAAQRRLIETTRRSVAAALQFDRVSARLPAERTQFYNQMFPGGDAEPSEAGLGLRRVASSNGHVTSAPAAASAPLEAAPAVPRSSREPRRTTRTSGHPG